MAHIIVVLDKSGSMERISHTVISGFNEFLQAQKRIVDNSTMTMLSFSDNVEVVFSNKPISEIQELTSETYRPEGMTALNDAIGKAITDYPWNNRTLMVIITDGEENSSSRFNGQSISQLIQTKTNEGWRFIYLCNNLGSASAGNNLGLTSARQGLRNPATQNLIADQESFGTVLSQQLSVAACAYRTTSEVMAIDELNSGISEMKIDTTMNTSPDDTILRPSLSRSFTNVGITTSFSAPLLNRTNSTNDVNFD